MLLFKRNNIGNYCIRKLIKDELIIQVDQNDKVLGPISKLDAHLKDNIESNVYHRAFSLFLINSNTNELLIQQRSKKKLLFPLHWSNSVCSHPLYNDIEINEENNIGIKHAAVRRLKYELGVEYNNLEDYKVFNKYKYTAFNNSKINDYDLGEAEIDYLIKLEINFDKINLNNIRKDEVEKYEMIKINNIKDFIFEKEQKGEVFSPWFKDIVNNNLFN